MPTEKGPEFRIVGGASREKKEEAKEALREALFNHFESLSPREQKMVKKFEYEKTDEERDIIDFANQETNRLRQVAGLEPFDIPYENYHLLPSKTYLGMEPRARKSVGVTSCKHQGILLNADDLRSNPLKIGDTILHETIHLKGHISVEAEEKGAKAKYAFFRFGVSVWGAQGGPSHGHFMGLHEAIATNEGKNLLPKMLLLSFYQKEREWLASNEAKNKIKKVAKRYKMPEDEIMWVDKENDKISGLWFNYYWQRKVLDFICTEIQKDCPDQYRDKDEVFREFLRSHFTGQLLPIARLVEKTFGDGSFRTLGDMTIDEESAILCMESLRKARVRQMKK